MAGNSTAHGRSVASKVVSILQTFAEGDVHSLTEMAHMAGLPISTAHRLATELASWGLLERTVDGQYRVGARVRLLSAQVSEPPRVHETARRVMEDLTAATRAKTRLGVLDGLEVAFIEKVVGHHAVSSFSRSATLPAHATALGKALLAFSLPGTVERVIAAGLSAFTPYTVTDADALRRGLAQTRLRCVAVDRWELHRGVSHVAVPVFGAGGLVLAALELEVGDLRRDLPRLQPALQVAARGLSRELAVSQSATRLLTAQDGLPLRNGPGRDAPLSAVNGHAAGRSPAGRAAPPASSGRRAPEHRHDEALAWRNS